MLSMCCYDTHAAKIRGQQQMVLAPGAKTSVPVDGERLNEAQNAALESGDMELYVVARIYYRDGLGTDGFTQGVLIRRPNANSGGHRLVTTHKYNEMR